MDNVKPNFRFTTKLHSKRLMDEVNAIFASKNLSRELKVELQNNYESLQNIVLHKYISSNGYYTEMARNVYYIYHNNEAIGETESLVKNLQDFIKNNLTAPQEDDTNKDTQN